MEECLRNRGNQPRRGANRLLFVAADHAVLSRLRDATRVALAWASIVDDVENNRLNIDKNQRTLIIVQYMSRGARRNGGRGEIAQGRGFFGSTSCSHE